MIPEAAVEAAARAVFLTGFPEGRGVAWDPWHPSAQGVMRDIRIALEAAAPHIRSLALEEAADEVSRISRIGRTPADDCTDDEKADYRAFESQASPEGWLRARAATYKPTP